MAKILIVDDEKQIREMISKYISHFDHECIMASDGLEALKIYKNNDFDVVIMDIMMPNLDGYETFKRMKDMKETHCIFLSALSQEYDKIYGFDLGSEDYVTKPFSLKELMSRVNVILKRNNAITSSKIIIDSLIIDEKAHQVTIDGNKINLANKEYELLLYLVKNRGNALTRESIISKVWGYEYDNDDRTLDTHMKLLRKDLKDYSKYITTIRGVGYRFEKEI